MPTTMIDFRSGKECSSLFDSSQERDYGIELPSTRRKVHNPAEACNQLHSKLPAGTRSTQGGTGQGILSPPRGRSATHMRLARRPCTNFADEEIRTSCSQPSWRKIDSRLILTKCVCCVQIEKSYAWYSGPSQNHNQFGTVGQSKPQLICSDFIRFEIVEQRVSSD